MNRKKASSLVTRQLFRLLPVQILLVTISVTNGIVSSLFATNFIGADSMSAVGLYAPVAQITVAVSTLLVGGAQILSGEYIGRNRLDKLSNVFSLDLILAVLSALLFTGAHLVMGAFNLSGVLCGDPRLRPLFNQYLMGQAAGILPLVLGNQLAAFLSLEHRARWTLIASIVYIVVNLALNYLFVQVLHLEVLGLALASSLGLWAFLAVQAQFFLRGKSMFRFSWRRLQWRECGGIARIGLPGAAGTGYLALRGILLNALLLRYAGAAGLSAFATANALLNFFWSIPAGMQAVSRMMISVSAGEEDRQTLTDVMRNAFFRFIPLMCAVSALVIALAVPLTRFYYRDPSDPVYEMTVWGFRILPLCMPLTIVAQHFTCYGQTMNKQVLVHLIAVLDGVVFVSGFSALLMPGMGIKGAYVANVLNGVMVAVVIVGYAWVLNRRFPRTMDQLMVIPPSFGAPESDRMDLSLQTVEQVVEVSRQVEAFCLEKGVDKRRAMLAGLCLEEMAGNVVLHGFTKDKHRHSVDLRVVYKDGELLLRIKDDCRPFDPTEYLRMLQPEDVTKNIGLRMVLAIAKNVSYQQILGMNVLCLRVGPSSKERNVST